MDIKIKREEELIEQELIEEEFYKSLTAEDYEAADKLWRVTEYVLH